MEYKELSNQVKTVLGTLKKLSKNKEDFSVSYSDISKVSKLEYTMVSSCLRILREKNFIAVTSGGGAVTNIYKFLQEVPEDAVNRVPDPQKLKPKIETKPESNKKDEKKPQQKHYYRRKNKP